MERRRRGSRSREAGAHRQSGRAHRRRVEHPRREVCYGLQRVLRWRPASAAAAANGRQENRSGEAVGEHTELNRNYVPRIALSGYRGPSTRPPAVAGRRPRSVENPFTTLRLRSGQAQIRSTRSFAFYGVFSVISVPPWLIFISIGGPQAHGTLRVTNMKNKCSEPSRNPGQTGWHGKRTKT